jgi:two-component system KDP operon response regulator KdpE
VGVHHPNAARRLVLVVEDEPGITAFLTASLHAGGYRVVAASTARRAIIDATTHKPDLAIVDLGLPDRDGIDVIRAVREWSRMPLIVLSARIDERSKIEALDAGANDYITKPFGVGELLARIRASLRVTQRPPSGERVLRFEDATIDLDARRATRGGEDIHLTPIEFRLLTCLANQLGLVVTHRQLLTEVWGPQHAGDTHYLRIYMKQLRDKLEVDPVQPRHLRTETGVGYRLVVDEERD